MLTINLDYGRPFVDGFTVRQIDEMHSTACNAIHGFIILAFPAGLHSSAIQPCTAQARVGAAVKGMLP